MKKYVCVPCGYVYDPEVGDPDSGIEPGTAFEDLPDDWVCPICGVGKEDFEPEEKEGIRLSGTFSETRCRADPHGTARQFFF